MIRLSLCLLLAAACSNESAISRLHEAPDVAISNPLPGAELRQGVGPFVFAGSAVDSWDGPEVLVATWTVDGVDLAATLDDRGHAEHIVDPQDLALGTHTVALKAVDSDGDVGFIDVDWTLLGPGGPPTVSITNPTDGTVFKPGQEITFRGTATDESTPASDLSFDWSSSVDGPLAGAISSDGLSVLFTEALTVDDHTITLKVVDSDGESAQDSVAVTVYDGPIDAEPGDLVFSELAVNPNVVEDMYGEWVELYNTSGFTIDLAGYTFHDFDFDRYEMTSVLVPPKSYVVLCASTDPAKNGGIETCDVGFTRTQMGGPGAMALGNAGDEVVLSRPDGVVIDQVVYNASWFTPAVATGLDPSRLDASNNDDETMWCDQRSTLGGGSEPGTPGFENDTCF